MKDTYSVWNWQTGRFDYYEAPARGYRSQLSYPGGFGSTDQIGASPEDSAVTVPVNATLVGSGGEAVGIVAERRRGSKWIVAAGAAGLLTWLLVR